MTTKQVIDKVETHLLAQGERCVEGDRCLYRNEAGLMCAVGVLIPNDQYRKQFENWQLEGIVDEVPALQEFDVELLHDMQEAHDHYGHPGNAGDWAAHIKTHFISIRAKHLA